MAKPGGWRLAVELSGSPLDRRQITVSITWFFYQMHVANCGVFVATCRDCRVCMCRMHPVGSFSILAILLKFQQQVGVTCRCDLQL